MKSVVQLYRYCNYLSLDVACGAMIGASFFARILNVHLRPYGLTSLGLTVWIIYTVDHLRDVRMLKQEASSQRHRFHQNYFRYLLIALVIAILIDLLVVFFVRRPILHWGLGLATIVLLYLWLQQRLTQFKELVVACLYSAGILLPAMSLTVKSISASEIMLISTFALTAFINLVLFSWYDREEDIRDNRSSLVTSLGRDLVRNILIVLFLIQAVLFGGLILFSVYGIETLFVIAMNLPLLLLLLFPEKFSNNYQYRLIGDSVFIIPIFYFL